MTESKDFKIDELGLYQTRDGIQTYISFIDPENNRAVGIRRGEADWRIWELNGQYFSCGESGLDVVDRWKTKSEYEESKTKVEGIEQKIDSWLNKVRNEEIECSRQGEYLLCEAKTYIQNLNSKIKWLNNLLDEKN